MPVWPGDPAFERDSLTEVSAGDATNLSTIRMSLHTGTHVDAPRHVFENGAGVDEIRLEGCLGRTRLATISTRGKIGSRDLEPVLETAPERLLLKCLPAPDLSSFQKDYRYLDDDAARLLINSGVKLFGTDAPSVDPVESRDLPVHHLLLEGGVIILENLWLRDVPDGEYELVALPLRIAGADGSPLRAVLLSAAEQPTGGGIKATGTAGESGRRSARTHFRRRGAGKTCPGRTGSKRSTGRNRCGG